MKDNQGSRPAGGDHGKLYKTHDESLPVKHDVQGGAAGRTQEARPQNKTNNG